MIKFGFYSPGQLSFEALDSFMGRRKFISLDLYDQMEDIDQNLKDEVQERMFTRFPMINQVFKYTFTNRFEAFDDLIEETILEIFPMQSTRALKIHDVGVSDGRTAVSFFNRLRNHYGDKIDFLATDYAPYVYVVNRKNNSWLRLIVDKDNNLLQIIAPPFVFNIPSKESLYLYPINHLIRKILMKLYVDSMLKQYMEKCDEKLNIREVVFVDSECRELMKIDDCFKLGEKDVLGPLGENYDIVRAMNLLNKGYFNENELSCAVKNIIQSLREGGLFIVGSNKERGTVVNGGIYRKQGTQMKCVANSGEGSHIHSMITKSN